MSNGAILITQGAISAGLGEKIFDQANTVLGQLVRNSPRSLARSRCSPSECAGESNRMTGIVPGGAPFKLSVQNLWAAEDSALPSEKADHDRMGIALAAIGRIVRICAICATLCIHAVRLFYAGIVKQIVSCRSTSAILSLQHSSLPTRPGGPAERPT